MIHVSQDDLSSLCDCADLSRMTAFAALGVSVGSQ